MRSLSTPRYLLLRARCAGRRRIENLLVRDRESAQGYLKTLELDMINGEAGKRKRFLSRTCEV